jgi:ketosteroid isomerase-like protein
MPSSAAAHRPIARLLIAVALVVCSAATARAQTPAGADSAEVPAAARAQIDSANAEWLSALRRRDAGAIVARYADSASVVMGNGQSVRGRAAIERAIGESVAQMPAVAGGKLVQEGLVRSGPLLYEWGRGELELGASGETPVRVVARYLTVWEAGADGRWRIIRNLTLP